MKLANVIVNYMLGVFLCCAGVLHNDTTALTIGVFNLLTGALLAAHVIDERLRAAHTSDTRR